MKFRLFHVLSAILLVSLFGCSKELSYEIGVNGGGNNNASGNFHAKIDGTAWAATNNSESAMILNGVININGTSSDGKMISITLVTGATGTYTVDANSSGVAAYNESNISYSTNQSPDPTLSGGSVTITEINQTNKTISGTFTFNGYDAGSGVKKVISEGVFDKLPYITTLPPAKITDTFKVKIGGVDFTAASIASPIVSGNLLVQGAAADGSNFVGLLMPQNVQPGSYTLDFFGGTYIGEYSPDATTNLVSQGNGTLIILENNTTTRRIKASFSFVASDVSNTQSVQLTEGYFSVGY